MITKNRNEVRLKSGNDFKVKFGGFWITLGNIVSGKLSKKTESSKIVWADSESFQKRTTRESMLEVVLGQVSKEIMDTIDQISEGVAIPVYFYNGYANSKHMEIFAPECEMIEQLELDMKGDSHQTIALKFSLFPQSGNATVTPSTDLPAGAHATSASLQTGTNPYYVVLDT